MVKAGWGQSGSNTQEQVDTGPLQGKRTDYALFIANDTFADGYYAKLNNPAFDAVGIEKILRERCGFKTEILAKCTRAQALIKLFHCPLRTIIRSEKREKYP